VDSSQIDSETSIDKNEQIVITREFKVFVSLVSETTIVREGISIVVRSTAVVVLITETTAVDRIESTSRISVDERTSSAVVRQCNIDRELNVKGRIGHIPLGELISVNYGRVTGSCVKSWDSLNSVE